MAVEGLDDFMVLNFIYYLKI